MADLQKINIDLIEFNPNQPRKAFSVSELEDLSSSISTIGIIHPPLVRILKNGKYELISGERRLRAAKLAGLSLIPVVITETDEAFSAEAALVENVQRVDLNPIEIAKSLSNLQIKFGLKQEELAVRIGKKRSTISNYLRLLALPILIQESLIKNEISMGHAKAILSLPEPKQQIMLYHLIVQSEFSVRQSEKKAEEILKNKKQSEKKPKDEDPHWEAIIASLQGHLGTKVGVERHSEGKGRLFIDFYSIEDLNRLLELMGIFLNT